MKPLLAAAFWLLLVIGVTHAISCTPPPRNDLNGPVVSRQNRLRAIPKGKGDGRLILPPVPIRRVE